MPNTTWWLTGQNFMTTVAEEVVTTCLSGRDLSRDLHPIMVWFGLPFSFLHCMDFGFVL
jgi:hypothetical protein